MALERGGRADKAGNRYELMCIIDELLNLVNETKDSVVIEAIGDDEKGTDILVTDRNGIKEHQQCKLRNASKEYWTIGDLKARGVMDAWHMQLNRGAERHVALVSPIGCSALMDLSSRVLNTNGNPDDFYQYQIQKNSPKFQKFYKSFCEAMNLDCTQKQDIRISMDYLRRIHMKQCSEDEIRERLRNKIGLLFCTDEQIVYNAMVTFVIDNHIWGREITIHTLLDFFQRQGIEERNLEHDSRIMPTVTALNQEYSTSFKTLREGLIPRSEFETCIHHVENETCFIISGSAGCGKSGCTEAIIRHCQDKEIPYLAIKLDRKMPKINSAEWEKQLGFPCSVASVLDAIAKSTPAVLILDQLDALRWTQANSYEAVSVCMQLIKKVENLNRSRSHKIVMIFVCRSYDLKNDANIKSLFVEGEKRKKWENVEVGKLDESTVRTVVGQRYETLREKTKQLLQTPSNLYIWQHLDEVHTSGDCQTTSHLIDAWYDQIRRNSDQNGVSESVVRNTLTDTVQRLDQTGRLYLPERILDVDKAGLDYLISAEMLVRDDGKIGFAHQSIFDYFVSKRMMEKFYDNCSIEEITGTREHQTPSKRYQIQMFLQNLLECSSGDFIQAGKAMLESPQVRYYVKFLFYELLGQIQEPDEVIRDFILENCEEEPYAEKLISQVFMGNHGMIHVLLKEGILQKWYEDPDKKEQIFVLLRSVGEELDDEDAAFIEDKLFIDEADDENIFDCFFYDAASDCDSIFELRMQLYERYPKWMKNVHLNPEAVKGNKQLRLIRILALCLQKGVYKDQNSILHTTVEILKTTANISFEIAYRIITELLPYFPKGNKREISYYEWCGRYHYIADLRRLCIDYIKKANEVIIKEKPEFFLAYMKSYMGKGYVIHNEIILSALKLMPVIYSDWIIEYLAEDLDKNAFEYTSNVEGELDLAKEVVKVHARYCSNEVINKFQQTVRNYVSLSMVDWYKRRIEYNREANGYTVYWSFWGDLQYVFLTCIPEERLTEENRKLRDVLERKFQGRICHYRNEKGHSGWVKSPVSGKTIGNKQWLEIITNAKIVNKEKSSWKCVEGGFIESSLELYAGDFAVAVQNRTEELVKMVIENKERVLPVYIDAMYSAIWQKNDDMLENKILEKIFSTFPCGNEGMRAVYFCGIILNSENVEWSESVLNQLKNIALNYRETKEQRGDEETENRSLRLRDRADCGARGKAMRAIEHILWKEPQLYEEFRDTIEKLTYDEDPAARMATLYALWPAYNIDRQWARKRILDVYESDIRTMIYDDTKKMCFLLYPEYKDRIFKLLRESYESEDNELTERAAYTICEFYVREGEFEEIITIPECMNETQMKAVLHMAVIYLKDEDRRTLAKNIILHCINSEWDLEEPLSSIFYKRLVDIEQDSEFLLKLLDSKASRKLVFAFSNYLEEMPGSVKEYAEFILILCRSVLEKKHVDASEYWGLETDASKLIFDLYDECAGSAYEKDKKIARECLDLWDMMFEKQIGQVRMLSRELMER